MTVLTCADVRELAPELALGVLGGAERAEVVLHVNGCAHCQASVSELAEVADTIPQLVPEAEPPKGFEARVLRRLDHDRRTTRRRLVATVAAVAAAAAIVSITVVRVIESGHTTPASPSAASHPGSPVAVAMHGGAGDGPAGWAYVSNSHGVAIVVDYGIPVGSYRVRAFPVDGNTTTLGTMVVDGGRGSWTGRSAVALDPGSRIALVDTTGSEVCRGTVPRAE